MDLPAPRKGIGHGIVVADGVLPFLQDAALFENGLRMEVPPPQQKLFPFSVSMVTIGAFQAVSSNVGRLLRLGMSQRIVVAAP